MAISRVYTESIQLRHVKTNKQTNKKKKKKKKKQKKKKTKKKKNKKKKPPISVDTFLAEIALVLSFSTWSG